MKDVVDSQRTYYDLRAEHYGDDSKPPDRRVRGGLGDELNRSLVDELRPDGDVLELACGTGFSTEHLVRHASTVTAVDASPQMIDRNRARVADPKVTYVLADLFEWRPERRYDTVFFSFWLSHVPPDSFGSFWDLVRSCLRSSGRVCFIDEDDRAAGHDDLREVDGVPVATRRLADGRTFDIVKVFWRPDDLEHRLRALGWDVAVKPAGDSFLYGHGWHR